MKFPCFFLVASVKGGGYLVGLGSAGQFSPERNACIAMVWRPRRSDQRFRSSELDRWRREQGEVARETDAGLVTMQVGPSARRRRALIAFVSLVVPAPCS